jgi:EAL domain-containing protein (putative c-di-GMP-specific phosphodiesterase class I)
MGTGLETPQALFAAAQRADHEYELDALCRRQALRNARGIAEGMRLFLNILPTSVHHPDFEAARVRDTLAGLGLSPKDVVLEISERQAISNFHIFREAIDHFGRLGFSIALDDVGTGYSSLEAAMELAPRYLKIDMSLVRSIEDSPEKQEVLRGLQSLSTRMGSRDRGGNRRRRARGDRRARHRVRAGLPPRPRSGPLTATSTPEPGTSR